MVKREGAPSSLIRMPIFPLPNSILFPGVYVPFHIFEDRYKLMLRKLEDEGLDLAVAYSPEVTQDKFFPSKVCGFGPVRVINRQPNGSSNILVFGYNRIMFHRYIQEIPYLIGEGEVLSINRDMPQSTERDLVEQLRQMLINWIFSNFDDSTRPIQFFKNLADLEILSNFVAYYFMTDLDKKQALLEENNLEVKAQAVWKVLKDLEGSQDQGPVATTIIFPGSHDEKH